MAAKMDTNHEFKYHYLAFKGRGFPMRLAFAIGDIKHEDIQYGPAETEALKASGKLPYEHLPYLEVDGKPFYQSHGLIWYIGRLAGLTYEDPIKDMGIMQVMFSWEYFVNNNLPGFQFCTDPVEKAARGKVLAEVTLPKYLKSFEKIVASNDTVGFSVGDKLTIGDLFVYQIWDWLCRTLPEGLPAGLMTEKDHPRCFAVAKTVGAHPKVQAYEKTHKY